MLAGQEMQAANEVLAVDGLYVPAAQAAQAADEVLAVDGLYVPAAQAVQEDWPAAL